MKANLLCLLVLVFLLAHVSGLCEGKDSTARSAAESLEDYLEPGSFHHSEPLPIKQVIGLVIAGLALVVILLFVFSSLMGPGERIREKMSETSDPFFTIVAILLIVLFLAMLQTYYSDLVAWLKSIVSSG